MPLFCLVSVGKVKEDHLVILILKVNITEIQSQVVHMKSELYVRSDKWGKGQYKFIQ